MTSEIDTLLDIGGPLDEPYYEGTGPRDPEETNLPIALDGRGYLLDLAIPTYGMQFQRRAVQLINTQQQDSSTDGALLEPEVWRRVIDSWHFGSGQTRYDREGSQPFRFDSSQHVNVWDEWGFSLLPRTINIQDLPAGPAIMVVFDQTKVFVAVGDAGYWYDDLSGNPATPPTPTTMTLPETVYSACSDGQNVYTLGTGGVVRKWTSATASTVFATVSPFVSPGMIRYVKRFIVVATGNTVWDVTGGGSGVLVDTMPLTDHRFVDACDGLSCGYLLGGIGDRWAVYAMDLVSGGVGASVNLGPLRQAAPLPDGEVGHALGGYLGYVVCGLNTGWRFGVPAGDGSLTFGRLVKTDTPVRCFEGQDAFVWFGADAPASDEESSTRTAPALAGLGRADLATFIAPMTPAAAADLTTGSDTGVVRNVGTVATSVQPLGRRLFTVDGVGLFLEHEHLEPEGYLDQGLLAFNTSDSKQGLYAQVYCEPLSGEIDVEATWDQAGMETIGFATQSGVTTLGNLRANKGFTTVQLRYTLRRHELIWTSGPRLTRVEFRAVPVPGRSTEWQLPILLHTTINDDNITQNRDLISDYDALVNLVETRRTVIYREGDRSYSVYAMNFIWRPHHLSEDGRSFEGTFILSIRESR